MLPFLAEGKFTGVTLQGVKDLQLQVRAEVRPRRLPAQPVRHVLVVPGDDRIPGRPSGCSRCPALWLTRRGRIPDQRWFSWFALITLPTPFLANSAGWVFTEMGRQPWVVVPNPTGDQMVRLTVQHGVSDHSAGDGVHLADRVHPALRACWP